VRFLLTFAALVAFMTLTLQLEHKEHTISRYQKLLSEHRSVLVTVTAYSPRKSETDDTPFETAFMTPVREGTVAISHDLLAMGWAPGMRIYLKGFGVFVIFTFDTKYAKKLGVNEDVLAVLMQ
jgi:hypothetical protein